MSFIPSSLSELLSHSCENFAQRVACSFVDGRNSYTYSEFYQTCVQLYCTMRENGIKRGDKVIILSDNMPSWSVAFFAISATGRVVVPILPDCSANEVHNIIAHSQANAAFVSKAQMSKICEQDRDSLSLIVQLNDFMTLKGDDCVCDGRSEASSFAREAAAPDDLAAILYTSGTSGNAKGVMLSHRNLCHNLRIAPAVHNALPDDIWLSFLPMAHTYELSLAVLFPFNCGSRVYYLDKAPTPSVIMSAIAKVQPTLICSVPLIIEKIFRRVIQPKIRRSVFLRTLFCLTPGLAHRLVGRSLLKTFGGKVKVFAIGGAKLDSEVESFLLKAGFPYAIGYGLTETAPLVCAAAVGKTKVGSTGWVLEGEQICLLDKDPESGIGELCVKGPNVMMGYYKDPERTAEAFTPDGWFRTKDLATIDNQGRVSIVGRIGNMILGASGENIYPEEIEMVIASFEGVEESIVKKDGGRLVALIKMQDEVIRVHGFEALSKDQPLKHAILEYVNAKINKASQLSSIIFVAEAFEKTATRKIRRFKY